MYDPDAQAELLDDQIVSLAPVGARPVGPPARLVLLVGGFSALASPGPPSGDDVIAVAGWYVATAITDCPPLAAIYRDGSLPEVRGDADSLAFCRRSGVLYASQSGLDQRANAGITAVPATVVIGVIVPLQLEIVGGESTEVVVLGRLVEPGAACPATVRAACRPELLVDHIAWTPDG